jgi:hypothetical protein
MGFEPILRQSQCLVLTITLRSHLVNLKSPSIQHEGIEPSLPFFARACDHYTNASHGQVGDDFQPSKRSDHPSSLLSNPYEGLKRLAADRGLEPLILESKSSVITISLIGDSTGSSGGNRTLIP